MVPSGTCAVKPFRIQGLPESYRNVTSYEDRMLFEIMVSALTSRWLSAK